jgi:hypothetical protein
MKTKTLFLLSLLVAASAFSEPLERVTVTGISMNVVSGVVKSTSKDHFKTNYGSSDIHTERERSITGTVTNRTRAAANVVVTIFWIGKKIGGNERVILPASELREIAIAPGGTYKLESSTGTVAGQDLKLKAIGERYTGGARIDGWVVAVRWNSTLVACTGSQSYLEELVRSGASAKLQMAEE